VTYSFGDTDVAARRLDLVSRVFDPPSAAFIAAVAPRWADLAIDLGCGPGNTTVLVHRTTSARRTVGLDQSDAFVAEAAARNADPAIDFLVHDVTTVPFPVGPAGFVFGRLLLAHLPEPATVVGRWLSQLAPGGRLALDEIQWIRTDQPTLAEYLSVVVALIASRGADMYAGPLLDGFVAPPGTVAVHDRIVEVPVPVPTAAEMFGLNLTVWGTDPWVREAYGAGAVERLGRQLGDLRSFAEPAGITWGLRQVAFERRG